MLRRCSPVSSNFAWKSPCQEYNDPMPSRKIVRGSFRDRHGRGIRRPILSKLFRHGDLRSASFLQIVAGAGEYLRTTRAKEFANLRWRVRDVPDAVGSDGKVQRWDADPASMTITLYRIPIERYRHFRNPAPWEIRAHIEHQVFAAAASLIGKEPWELIPPGRVLGF